MMLVAAVIMVAFTLAAVFALKGLWVLAAMMAALVVGLVAAVMAERKGGQDARAPRDGRFAGGTPSDERTWRP